MESERLLGLDAGMQRVILTVVSEDRCPVFRVGDRMALDLPSVDGRESDAVCGLAVAAFTEWSKVGSCSAPSPEFDDETWFCPRTESPVEFRVDKTVRGASMRPVSSLGTEDLPAAVAELRGVSVFRALPASTLGEVASYLTIETYPAGATLLERGRPGTNFYIISRGSVEVIGAAGAKQESVIRVLKERDVFGEMSLLTNSPVAATIRAKTEVVVHALAGSRFLRLLQTNALLSARLASLLAARLLATNYLLVREGNQAFRGKLTVMNLATVLQVLGEARRSGRLRLRAPSGEEAWIGYRQGEVLDALCGQLRGSDAIYALLKWTEGDFWLESKPVPAVDTIQAGIVGLLLEGMRRIDEG